MNVRGFGSVPAAFGPRFCAPIGFASSIVNSFVDIRRGFLLQLSNASCLIDHCPLVIRFQYQDWHFDPHLVFLSSKRWTLDSLAAFAKNSHIQDHFVEDIDEWIDENNITSQINQFSDAGLIDKDDFIESVIDSDGWGALLNSYDGTEEEERVNGESYYIFSDDTFNGF